MPVAKIIPGNSLKQLGKAAKLMLLLAVLLGPLTLRAQQKGIIKPNFQIFKLLDTTAITQRVEKAGKLYKQNYRHASEADAMATLDTLAAYARKLDDQGLECSVFALRADYYSINKGFNEVSLSYHQQAIEFAESHHMPLETAIYLHKKGLYYFTFNRNTDACRYFLRAYDRFKQIGFNKIPDISTYILEQAKFYYTVRDFATAKPMLLTALKYPIANTRVRINVISTIGLIYRNAGQYPQALNYFNRALDTARLRKDSAWIGITVGNIGSVYFSQHQYARALPYLLADYNASVKYQQYSNAAQTLLRISKINLENADFKRAATHLDSVQILLHKAVNEDILGLSAELYDQKSLLYQRTGRLDSAVIYIRRHETAKDSLAVRNNMASVERVRLQYESDRYKGEINKLKNDADADSFKRNALITIIVLVVVVFFMVFNRFRLDAKREQEKLKVRKRRVDEKLKTAAEVLEEHTQKLIQNQDLIEKFKLEIERFKAESTERSGTEHLEKLMQAHIMTDESWDEFKKLFTKVHVGFFVNLRNTFPTLTDTDMRLLSLVKLGLNNREMANMLGITLEGIKKSKQRLRKKMQLNSDTAIEETIASL